MCKKVDRFSLKTAEVLLGINGHLPEFNIYQGTVALTCFKSHTIS